jgi:hypothetical protein
LVRFTDYQLGHAVGTDGIHRGRLFRTTADLAHAGGRRIIKLHGSLGTSGHFIIAEEDYRTYPTRFAAFVSLARQVFIESELCLLGFSGDDPILYNGQDGYETTWARALGVSISSGHSGWAGPY